ncbi:hypothetical protein FDP41_008769 [Naegleria fowleri]|uniref:Amino acid transporter n=1 Tax=Naegleria fowleri TaxID=5763 RepID=A0A6A5B4N8_NAEFO|nr:uncharacterized protein FDP41_008769 [Naegleria fowleri]KAF0972917.1 hypothetical protein FDP41_008769 [Naegleria fowleri]
MMENKQEETTTSNVIMTSLSPPPRSNTPPTSYETFSTPLPMENVELSQQEQHSSAQSYQQHHHYHSSSSSTSSSHRSRRHQKLLENDDDEENPSSLEQQQQHKEEQSVNEKKTRNETSHRDHLENHDDHDGNSNPIQSTPKIWKTRIKIVLGLIIGVSVNVAESEENSTLEITPAVIAYVKLPGDLLLRALNCLIVPLIVSSMISSITSIVDSVHAREETSVTNSAPTTTTSLTQNDMSNNINNRKHKALLKMALMTLSIYLVTTVIAVITGLVMVNVIKPGQVMINNPSTNSSITTKEGNSLMSQFKISNSKIQSTSPSEIPSTMVSLNGELFPLSGVLRTMKTQQMMSSDIISTGNSSSGTNSSSSSYKQIVSIIESFIPNNLIDAASAENGGSVNVLGLIVFSIFMAIVMIQIGEPAKPVIKFFKALNDIILKMVAVIICYAPIGIMFLIIWRCVKEKYLLQSLSQLLIYMLTVLSGLVIHSFITLTIIYLVLVRKNILRHVWGVFSALLTALGTSSSSATLPLTMKCCEEKIGAQKEVTSFVLPLGSTVNMDGTALYEAVAAVFIAQSLQISLGIGDMIVVAITATLASIGAAGIPEAGLVTLILVIESVGLPKEAVSLILAVDWFLDRFRTCVNVYGDTICTAIVDKYVRFDRISKKTDEDSQIENDRNKMNEISLDNVSENTKLV